MTLLDIDPTLRAALSSVCGAELSRRMLPVIATSVPTATMDWDEGAGESWARFLVGDRVVAFVFMEAPLAILLDDIYEPLASDLASSGCSSVRVASMESAILCSSRHAVLQLAGRPVSENFTHERFSAEDLVWATI